MSLVVLRMNLALRLLMVFGNPIWWLGQGVTSVVAGTLDTGMRVACVGDSITFGAHLKNPNQESYPAVLGRMLGPGFEVRNFGVGGATLLKKGDKPYFRQIEYTNALACQPEVVVIMLGTNDSKHRGGGSLNSSNSVNNWQYKADYIPDYEDLINQFRKANPAVKIYVCLPTPCFHGSWGINDETIRKEIIPLVRQVAAESRAKLIDLNGALAGRKELFPDTVHPNEEGAKLIAAAVYSALTGKETATITPSTRMASGNEIIRSP
jgi:acyl-CoA thioesterase I